MVALKEARKNELRNLIREVSKLISERLASFEREAMEQIADFFSQCTGSVSQVLFQIQNSLDLLAPFIAQAPKQVESHEIDSYLRIQEKMFNDLIPQIKRNTDQIATDMIKLDLFFLKEKFVAQIMKSLNASLNLAGLISTKDPVPSMQRKIEKRFSPLSLSTQNILENLPRMSMPISAQTDVKPKLVNYPHFSQAKSEIVKYLGHQDIVTHLCILDHNHFASASGDYSIKIWKISEGICCQTLTGHIKDVWGLARISNTLLASCSADRTIRIWNTDLQRKVSCE